MNTDTTHINPGSSATDFQPTTQNPQQIGGSGVQTTTTNVQPSGSGASAQELYQQADRQNNLKVQTDNYSTNTQVSVSPMVNSSNNGLVTVTSALVILLAIIAIINYFSRQVPIAANDVSLIESPVINTPDALDTTEAVQVQKQLVKKKQNPVTKKKKKSSKKK